MVINLIIQIETESDRQFMIEIYEKYYSLMYSQAKRIIPNSHVVEDLMHDAFIRLINNLQTIRTLNCSVLRSYLVTTIKRVCFSYLSKSSTKREMYGVEEKMNRIEDNNDIEEKTITAVYLKDAIKQIPPRDQDLLKYKYLLEMTEKEIGECVDIPEKQVHVYVGRAKKKALSIMLKEEHSDGKA